MDESYFFLGEMALGLWKQFLRLLVKKSMEVEKMWIRLLGSILVVSATTMFGMSVQQIELNRKKELLSLERGILLLKQQLACFGMPLDEIFETVGGKISGTAGLIFTGVAERMRERSGGSVAEIFSEVVALHQGESALVGLDFEALYAFSDALESLARKENEGSIDFLLTHIKKEVELLEQRIAKNGKLYIGVGFLSGLLLVVMMW